MTNQTGVFAHIVGWGMAVPETVLTNRDLEAIVDTSDEWIRSRTGIAERRIANERESTTALGFRAAQQALDVANILPTDLDLIITATSTPENVFPSTASLIQDKLGATKAGAFDLSAACSGFVYGMELAAQAIRSGSIQSALVIGAETMSRIVNWQDRGTCILFGDGAGAVVLKASPVEGGIIASTLRSDGSGGDLLYLPTFGMLDPGNNPTEIEEPRSDKLVMNGSEVFKFATRVIAESITQVLAKAGLTIEDVSIIIPHQANIRIIQAAARALKVEPDLFFSNLDKYGNTSAASIPIALCEAIQRGRVRPDDTIVFVGFGAGLTWAASVIKWRDIKTAESAPVLSQQRRQFSYMLANLRGSVRKASRQINDTVSRVRPKDDEKHD